MKPGDLVVSVGSGITLLWDRPPLFYPSDSGETGKLSLSETGLVVETVGTGTDACVKVLSSNGQVGWNWEYMFDVVPRGGG
jgi:hypothetical protein